LKLVQFFSRKGVIGSLYCGVTSPVSRLFHVIGRLNKFLASSRLTRLCRFFCGGG